MEKDGKSRFFAYNIRHFYPIQKKTLEKKFVIEWYQVLIINHKTDFSSADTNILKSRVFDPYLKKKNFFFLNISWLIKNVLKENCFNLLNLD